MSRQQIHILHVDDESDLTDLTKTFLEREEDRFSVETATSADKGLQLLAESEIDCIVSDYEMPGMNGIEFLNTVAEEYPNLPFILYTGKGSEEVASDAISAGVTDYLQKKSGTDTYALLANRIVNAVNSRRREQRIELLQTFENELTELAIDFLRTKERDIDILIDDTLEKIGTLVDADRTYVFDIDHEAETTSNTYEWCAEGVDPQIHNLQDIPMDALPWWMQNLENFENIIIPNVSKLPPEAQTEQEILEEQNIESLIVTPMISNDELVGFIGFDWVNEQEAWSDEFINILRMVGELITTARKRKAREQTLQTLKGQYETLAENFPSGAVFLIDTDLKYVRAGGEELSKVGLSPDDIEGAKPHDLFPDEVSDELCHYYEEALDGNANTFEQVYGGERYRIQTVPVRTDGEDIDHVMAVSQNVTERVEDKQNLEVKTERLEEFASIVSHDLRSPLSVATGNLELVRDDCESPHLENIERAHSRMKALIEDLLTLAREGESVTDTEAVNLASVVRKCWNVVETTEASLTIENNRTVVADEARLKQLFENLIRNAVEHGGSTVAVTVGGLQNGFYIEDDGPGIPEDDAEAVFEAGYSTNDKGTGFGLSIVQRVVEAHGWDIRVTNSSKGGARFEIIDVEFITE